MSISIRASLAVVLFLLASLCRAQAPDAGPYRVGGEVTRPEKISGDPPEYTEPARRARVTGVVILEAVIDEQGNVTDPRVLKGLPMGLDQKAVAAVSTWKYKPATLEGKPVPVYFVIIVTFQLDGGFNFGPLLGKYMQDHPEFAELVRSRSYDDGLRFLDRQPYSDEVHLARASLLAALGRVDDAWAHAQAYDGPEPYEVSELLAEAAREEAEDEPDDEACSALVDLGLQAVERALAAKPGDPAALSTRAALLRLKAELDEDGERPKLLDGTVPFR
jgi:TonB family protein